MIEMPRDNKGRALLRGCGTALVTPFKTDGSLDGAALRAFVKWQLDEGIHFVVPCGSTGEAATMSPEEHRRVVEITVEVVNGRVPVVAGAGSNDTKRAIALSKEMESLGVTHLLHTSPMYNKPPQRGIIEHYRAIADSVDLPLVVYNVPGRTGSNVEASTTLALAEHENITAVKEASGNLGQIAEIIRNKPENFTVLSGDDALTISVMAEGGDGVVSVTSNVLPMMVSRVVELWDNGETTKARDLAHQVFSWTSMAFIESNPIPTKAALALMGRMENVLRLPLVPLRDEYIETVRAALGPTGALDK
ncbi:MAG: 4-hydroxy-tetrahydrodipicolinate synthase [Gemmatimonadales bacterium]